MNECTLVNLVSGLKISGKSVIEFCDKAELRSKNDNIHIYPILKGQRLHHKNWCLEETYLLRLHLEDIYGNEYMGSVKELLYTYNVKPSRLWSLITGQKKNANGLFLKGEAPLFAKPRNFKVLKYELTTPKGKTLVGKKIVSLHRQLNNKVSYKSLGRLMRGQREKVKGFKVKALKIEKKKVLEENYIGM